MTIMAEDYGADIRLVAFMQYSRVVLVAGIASVVAKLAGVNTAHHVTAIVWFPEVHWLSLAETLALAVLGPVVAKVLRIPAGAFLVPLLGGIVLMHLGWMNIELPTWLLAMSYALVGWNVGLRFTRPLLIHAARALPRMLACTLTLIVLCGGIAVLMVVFARNRSDDRLPGDQPRRFRFDRHHRGLEQCRCFLRHGDADRAHAGRHDDRARTDTLHCAACQPDSKMTPALIALCGLAFSGKSTIARQVAQELDAELVSCDAINAERGFDGGKAMDDGEWEKTSLMAAARAGAALADGRGVVVDDTFSHRFLRDRFRAVAGAAGVPFVLLFVDTPLAVIEARIARQCAHPSARPYRARCVRPPSRSLPVSRRRRGDRCACRTRPTSSGGSPRKRGVSLDP